MTDEELEKKAEKYFKNIGKECGYDKEFEETGKRHYWIGLDIKKAYIAGAKENGLQWHDLRKNPQDLPEERYDVLCFAIHNEHRYHLQGYYNDGAWRCIPLGICLNDGDVKVWCELPKFEE